MRRKAWLAFVMLSAGSALVAAAQFAGASQNEVGRNLPLRHRRRAEMTLLRLIPALAALAALATAVPSAAQVGSGRIAYATEGTGIYTVAADGSDRVTLKSDNARLPRWSPDGSKLAFIELGGQHELRVMNADGTDEHVVATGDIWLSSQPWSRTATESPGGRRPTQATSTRRVQPAVTSGASPRMGA